MTTLNSTRHAFNGYLGDITVKLLVVDFTEIYYQQLLWLSGSSSGAFYI